MLRIFLLFPLLALVACTKNVEQDIVTGQATLRHSLTLSEDTIIWPAHSTLPGLTIDSPEEVILDFGGALVQSATFGESPDKHHGLAIRVLRSPAVRIRNATFSGFKKGILVEEAGHIQLENVQFIDFNRGKDHSSVAVHLKQPTSLNVENGLFKHLHLAFQLDAAAELEVTQTKFYWLTGQVLVGRRGSRGSFINNHFFYIGNPWHSETLAFRGGELTFRENHWAHVQQSGLPLEQLIGAGNQAAYQDSLPSKLWSLPQLEQRLREIGVSAPGLRLYDDWGWYDFSYPKAWIRQQEKEKDIFLLTAPTGNWRLVDGAGYDKVVPKTGSFPSTLQAYRSEDSKDGFLGFEYLGKKFRKYGVHPPRKTPLRFSTHTRKKKENPN